MLNFLYDMPLWISGPGIILTLIASALGGLALVRRHLLPKLRFGHEHGHFGGAMIHSIMVFYGLVAALIAVDVWETHSDISKIVSHEAAAVAAMYRDAGGYPEPTRSLLQDELRGYVEYVIHEAWPLQRAGRVPSGGVERMDRVRGTLVAFQPANEGQSLLHGEALRAYNDMIEVRRLRLDAVHTALPGMMWVVMLLGAAVCIFASYFFQVDDGRLHALFVGLLAVLIGLILVMTLALDAPFRGDLGVSAEPYQLIHDQLMKQ